MEIYLHRCINSLINQTFKDFEIIIIDDCSTDGSLKIIENFSKKYDNIILIKNQKNMGVSYSRNIAIKKARGEYICFLDSDDWYNTQMLEEMYNIAKNKDLDVVICDVLFEYEDGISAEFSIDFSSDYLMSGTDALKELLTHKNNLQGYSCNKMYKREKIIKNNIFFPEELKLYEDIIFNIKVFQSSEKIKYIKKNLYHYFQHPSSVTQNKIVTKQMIDDLAYFLNSVYILLFKNQSINNEMNSLFNRIILIELLKVYRAPIEMQEKKKVLKYFQKKICNNEIYRNCIRKVSYHYVGKNYKNIYIWGKVFMLFHYNTIYFMTLYLYIQRIKRITKLKC